MKLTTNLKNSLPLLSIQDTFEFTKNLDLALRSVDIQKLKDAFIKGNLLSHIEAKDFLLQGDNTFKKYHNPEEGVQLISVADRNTKCSACTFGKTVRAYDVKFKKKESFIYIIYTSSFAINLKIINGELYDYAWCNFFLNKKEMEDFIKI